MAILLDRLSQGATDYTPHFSKAGVMPLARKIADMAWEHSAKDGGHNFEAGMLTGDPGISAS